MLQRTDDGGAPVRHGAAFTFGLLVHPVGTSSGRNTPLCLTARHYVLPQARNVMSLGYTDPAKGAFTAASSVQLRNTMRVSDDEATRKACYEVRRSGGWLVSWFVG